MTAEPREDELLFCPFCRECYEGTARCPEHELPLVRWQDLPKRQDEQDVFDTDALTPVDPRFGRAELGAGALVLLGSFLAPLFTVSSADVMSEPRTFSALAAAADQAPNLWTLPFVGLTVLSLVLRRRTPRAMRGARLAVLGLALAVPASLAYTLHHVRLGAAQLSAARSYAFHVELEWGVALPLVAAVLLAVGAMRFGVVPVLGGPPPDEDDGPHEPGSGGEGDDDAPPEPAPSKRRPRRRRR